MPNENIYCFLFWKADTQSQRHTTKCLWKCYWQIVIRPVYFKEFSAHLHNKKEKHWRKRHLLANWQLWCFDKGKEGRGGKGHAKKVIISSAEVQSALTEVIGLYMVSMGRIQGVSSPSPRWAALSVPPGSLCKVPLRLLCQPAMSAQKSRLKVCWGSRIWKRLTKVMIRGSQRTLQRPCNDMESGPAQDLSAHKRLLPPTLKWTLLLLLFILLLPLHFPHLSNSWSERSSDGGTSGQA